MDEQHLIKLLRVPAGIVDDSGTVLLTNPAWDQFETMVDHAGKEYSELNRLIRAPHIKKECQKIWRGKNESFEYYFRTIARDHCQLSITKCNENRMLFQVLPAVDSGVVAENAVDVLESMNEAFFSLDENWCFTYVNHEAEKVLFKSREELIGKNMWLLFPDAWGTNFEEHYFKTMHDQIPTRFEEYYGPIKSWFEVTAYPNRQGGLSVYFRNINKQKEMEKSLWQSANSDHLTGLPNRRYSYELMKDYIEKNHPFTIYFLDLDQFKIINDLYGHDVGDRLIHKIGMRLQKNLPEEITISRLGGDEYLILVPDLLDKAEVEDLGNRLIGMFSKAFVLQDRPEIHVEPSVGVSQFPKDGNLVDTLIDKADIAMYEAKKKQLTKAVMYDPVMHESVSRDLIIQQELKKVIERGELEFVYQPQIDSRRNWITGVEVLTRWTHPVLGPVSPAEFIPIAETSGMMEKLTRYQLDWCLSKFSDWRKHFSFDGVIAFNISSGLFRNKNFIAFLEQVIREHKIPFDQIELEITENIQLFSHKESVQTLERLRDLGIRVAIDDFGTGYSTLSYLNQFPVDKIKIDKHFTDQIMTDIKGEAILVSIIKLANSLELDVLAEGVETEEQRDFLKMNGCSDMQGYYYFKPMTLTECEQFYYEKVLKERVPE
ncbi:sensor domain-containing protein [Jeotgalibacillus terrae]|uniref:EAL domain-containing protein n=1 Tax=Jeotgalibacillus terrae TaxID=587735 RepID=A0ABW5ZE92_9BACL|nr:GGDEF domain-containing phosphodiesterase [Jeotgalibacillus terrae]MBM7577765.1 diguanylate cyclase (GGDEF)-like protein/PAS domain S-box-containing protein [Jeotgalibacillus terrae]